MKHQIVMYGGAFNPPHLDHSGIVEALLEKVANQVIIIPTGEREDKSYGTMSSKNREELVRQAFGELGDKVMIDTHFLYSSTPSTTRNQAEYLREKYAHEVPQVFGSDVIPHMNSWDPEGYVARQLPKIFIARPGHIIDSSIVANFDTLEFESNGISSTQIRKEVQEIYRGKPSILDLSKLVSKNVLDCIFQKKLFYT